MINSPCGLLVKDLVANRIATLLHYLSSCFVWNLNTFYIYFKNTYTIVLLAELIWPKARGPDYSTLG